MAVNAILDIERRATRAVPAVESTTIQGWHVPFGRGEVRRMNAVTAFGIVPWEPLDAIELVERRYAGRHRPSRFRMTPLDAVVDDLLYARGYDRSVETLVMRGKVAGESVPEATLIEAVTPGWLEALARLGEYSDLRIAEIGEGLAALDLRHGAFRIDDHAVGLAVVDTGWVGLFDIAVSPDQRRRNLGTRISLAMLGWAVEHGATDAYLQVMADNTAAVSMYERLGFEVSHRYWYRTKVV